jgi:hypothetical protein
VKSDPFPALAPASAPGIIREMSRKAFWITWGIYVLVWALTTRESMSLPGLIGGGIGGFLVISLVSWLMSRGAAKNATPSE